MTKATGIALQLAEDCGYAIAVMESFMTPTGTTGERIREAINRLQDSSAGLSEFVNASNNTAGNDPRR